MLYHFARRLKAIEEGRIGDVSNHAMRLGYYVAQALHLEAWGEPALKHRNIREAGRLRAGKTKADPAAVRARYNELIESGQPRKAALALVMAEFDIKSDKTARSYLR